MEVNLDVIYHPEKYRINGDVEDIDTIIADKAEFITSFCEVIMKKPQNAELNGDEVSMIDLCVKDIYKNIFTMIPNRKICRLCRISMNV